MTSPGQLGAALALALAPLLFLHPVLIAGRSMEPRLRPGSVCLPLRSWCAGNPAAGQIWLIRTPTGTAVKRLVGVPGDRLELRQGALWVNGRLVHEPYAESGERDTAGPWTMGSGYFLLGDNRPESHDSRAWGSLPAAGLLGRILH